MVSISQSHCRQKPQDEQRKTTLASRVWSRYHEVKRDLHCGTDSDESVGRIKAEQREFVNFSHGWLSREGAFKDGCGSEPGLGEQCHQEQKQFHLEKRDFVENMIDSVWDMFGGRDSGRAIKWNILAVRHLEM